MSAEAKQQAIEQHEARERRALCHRSALRDWAYEQQNIGRSSNQDSGRYSNVGSNPTLPSIKDLNTRIAVLEKQLEERPPSTINKSSRI
jgi:hypothetical protein